MPREASATTSVLQQSAILSGPQTPPPTSSASLATLHHPLASPASAHAHYRDGDPHTDTNKGSQGPSDGYTGSSNATPASRNSSARPRRGGRRDLPSGSQTRGKQPPSTQQQQQQSPVRPPLGTDGPVTLMKRSPATQDDRAPLPHPQVTAFAHPPPRQQSLPVASSSSSATTLPMPGRSSEELPVGYSRSGGILQLPPDARPTPSENQPSTAVQRPSKGPATGNRSLQNHQDRHPHRSNETRHDAGSARAPHLRTGGQKSANGSRRQRNQGRDSPEVFDRGTADRSADGHQSQHQLFDPRRHNALSFSRGIANSTGTASVSDARTSSVAGSTAPTSAPSVASSEGRERRKRRGGAQSDVSSSSKARDEANASGGDGRSSAAKAKSSGASGYVNQLAKVYRDIQALETQLKEEHQAASDKEIAGPSRQVARKASGNGRTADGSIDHAFWLNLTQEHKNLADLHSAFLDLALRPGLPSSHHSLPQEYNLPIRLWHVAFHLLLERLRHSLPYPSGMPADGHIVESEKQVQNAIMDHLTDFIYYAYGFYSALLEGDEFRRFKAVWLENLGDLARYRMAVAGLNASFGNTSGGVRNKATRSSQHNSRATSPNHLPRIDDEDDSASQSGVKQIEAASIGSAALGDWEFEDRETWSTTAKGWYAKGLAVMPGTGRLHHHLALLSRPDALRSLHHFCKGLTTLQPFAATRESILSLFGPEDQRHRLDADATLVDLFVHLHGMLFTRVQLDDFSAVSARFLDKLRSTIEDVGWEAGIGSAVLMMMGTVNVASLMQYGSDSVILQSLTSAAPAANSEDAETTDHSSADANSSSKPQQELDEHPQQADSDLPISLQNSIKLTFAMFKMLLPRGMAGQGAGATTTPNPYVTIVMTLLFRLARAAASSPSSQSVPTQLQVLDAAIPWSNLASLPTLRPGLQRVRNAQKISALRPLPEDWCLRGLSWTGRRLFERDFFKTAEESAEAPNATRTPSFQPWESEVDVLSVVEETETVDVEEAENSVNELRWERIALALNSLLDVVPGFEAAGGLESAKLEVIEVREPLSARLAEYAAAEEAATVEQQTARLHLANKDAASHADLDDAGHLSDEEGDDLEDFEDDSEEMRELKARIRELRTVLNQKPSLTALHKAKRGAGKNTGSPRLVAVPGYTTLVLDTNVILTGKATFLQKLVESHYWTVIVPLAVVTELEGLSRNPPPLGQDATSALSYLETSLKVHCTWLKVQTSKGNYLTDLSFRHEDLDLDTIRADDAALAQDEDQPGKSAKARTLDEVIFRCFLWQRDHWTDRRNLVLGRSTNAPPPSTITSDTPKAIMVTLDRGLRLRVRSKGCPAAGKQELADILTTTSLAFKA